MVDLYSRVSKEEEGAVFTECVPKEVSFKYFYIQINILRLIKCMVMRLVSQGIHSKSRLESEGRSCKEEVIQKRQLYTDVYIKSS